MRVAKRKGMEKRNLLSEESDKGNNAGEQSERDEEDDEEGSIWSNFAPKKVVENLSKYFFNFFKNIICFLVNYWVVKSMM